MKSLVSQIVILLSLSVALGLGANQLSPRGIPLVTPSATKPAAGELITPDQAKQFWRDGALFLDARDPADYAAGHIGNALSLPAQSLAEHFGEIAPVLTAASALVLYCDGVECELSHRLAQSLRERGYTNLHILPNGWTAWRAAGGATSPGIEK